MLTLASFVIEKFGGDTMERHPDEPRDATEPAWLGRSSRRAGAAVGPAHGLSGTDEAGSGGDD